MSQPVFLSNLGIVNALGCGQEEVFGNLMAGSQHGMVQQSRFLIDETPIYVGSVHKNLPEIPKALDVYDSRNARILLMAADQIRDDIENTLSRVGPERIAVVVGSSTSGIEEAEKYFNQLERGEKTRDNLNVHKFEQGAVSECLTVYFGIQGPAYTISTACSSASHALASGQRLLNSGLVDAVVAGGVDSLCQLTTNGFQSLSLLSKSICSPFSKNRDGINIGEGAALFLMQREETEIALLGCGASSDAYSITAPDPKGEGIQLAILEALSDASLQPKDITYIHLHGTGTFQNDAAESKAIQKIFNPETFYSSSKSQIGHTLAAAGAMGAAHCWLALHHQNKEKLLPPHIWDGQPDFELLTDNFVAVGQTHNDSSPLFLINAFAFGGNNVSLILGSNI